MSDEADRFMDATESADPALCDQYGHQLATTIECVRCGITFFPADTEGTR